MCVQNTVLCFVQFIELKNHNTLYPKSLRLKTSSKPQLGFKPKPEWIKILSFPHTPRCLPEKVSTLLATTKKLTQEITQTNKFLKTLKKKLKGRKWQKREVQSIYDQREVSKKRSICWACWYCYTGFCFDGEFTDHINHNEKKNHSRLPRIYLPNRDTLAVFDRSMPQTLVFSLPCRACHWLLASPLIVTCCELEHSLWWTFHCWYLANCFLNMNNWRL